MMKLFDGLILTAAFIFNLAALDADVRYALIALSGSLSGAMILAYFRRDSHKIEQFFKAVCAAISGLVIGALAQEYFRVAQPQYVLSIFFFASLLSLVMLRSLLTMTERNGREILKDAFQRILNLQTKEERRRRRRRRPLDKSTQTKKEGEL